MTARPTSEGNDVQRTAIWRAEGAALAAVLFVLAAGVRFAYLAEASSGPFFESGGVDSTTYLQRAFEAMGTHWPGEFAFEQPPLYPLFLAALGSVFGKSIWALKAIQVVLGSITCVLVYFIGRRAFRDERVAILAALACCFNGTLIYFDGQIVSASLETFLVCAAILALLHAGDRDSALLWMTAGLALGLATINRGAVLVSLPFIVWWLFRKEGGMGTSSETPDRLLSIGLRRTALLGLPIAACLLPVTLHNIRHDLSRNAPPTSSAQEIAAERTGVFERIANRDFVVLTSLVGMNLYLGNSATHYETNDPNHPDCFSHANHVMRLPYRTTGDRSASGQQRALLAHTAETIRADPAAWLKLVGYKLLLFLNGLEIPRNANLYAERSHSTVLQALLWPAPVALPGAVLFPLGLLGLFLERRAWREHFVLLAFMLPRALLIVGFFVAARLRLPLVPIVALFAAFALIALIERARANGARGLAAPLIGLLLLSVISNLPLATPHTEYGAYEHFNHANHLARLGASDVALSHYRKAVATAPDSATAHFMLGVGLDRARQPRAAIESLETTLRIDPGFAEAAVRLGRIHQRAGRMAEAAAALDRALEIDPDNAALRAHRATLDANTPTPDARRR